MKVIKTINAMDEYFLSDVPEEITLSDRCWFYGSYGIIILLILLVVASI